MNQTFNTTELRKIIDNINEYVDKNCVDLFKIGLVGAGEPLLEFDLIKDIIEYVAEKNYDKLKFYTITNGTIIDPEKLMFFFKHREDIALNFSLDGYDKIHNAARQKYSCTMKNILAYERLFGQKPAINCTVHKLSFDNADKLLVFFKEQNFTNIAFSRLADTSDSKLFIDRQAYSDFLKKCKSYGFTVRQLKNENKKKYDCTIYGNLCGVGKTNIFITKKGVYPCGRFYGNEKYNMGCFGDEIEKIEIKMMKYKEMIDGECYFDKCVTGRK